MRRQMAALLAFGLACGPLHSATRAPPEQITEEAAIGRWDITIQTPTGPVPSWLEIRRSGSRTFVGQFVGVSGSARPISRIEVNGGELRFAIPAQWEKGTEDLSFQGRVQGDKMSGSITFPDRKRHDWTAIRAPSLHRSTTPRWAEPIHLLNKTDLTGWRTLEGQSRWHVELRFPEGSNSGVYLRGRYEVQIADQLGEPASDGLGAVYGFIAPNEDAGKGPNEWQSLDITLVGRRITVVLNDKTVICDQDIPGITGGALDSDEGAPGPLLLQGDHGPVEFRNIILTPAR
jgi:hypothetical protein